MCVSKFTNKNFLSCRKLSVSVKRPGLYLELHKNTTEKDPGAPERFVVNIEERGTGEQTGLGIK